MSLSHAVSQWKISPAAGMRSPEKPVTIACGQGLPADVRPGGSGMRLFIATGSRLVVYPAAALPVIARRNKAQLMILNREPAPPGREAISFYAAIPGSFRGYSPAFELRFTKKTLIFR